MVIIITIMQSTCARKMELGRCPLSRNVARVEHDSDDNLGGACPILRAECQTERRILRPQKVAVMALIRLANSSNYCPAEIHSYSHTRSVKVCPCYRSGTVLASTKQNRRDHQPNLASLCTGSGLNIPNQGPFVGTKSRGKKRKKRLPENRAAAHSGTGPSSVETPRKLLIMTTIDTHAPEEAAEIAA
ncbi:hypothetical protein A9K55_003965 [Cordyceps militaris]|uniref:Uncharacterized protein n=1 Tax=Cordyceps militaris TaxID=73501 RepID=A0A2H4SL61_CORMI|nr:hypothetical protein A9K55_003965 [Cordyceps militaris]